MLNYNEITRFADMLDKEYADEIIPLVKDAQRAIDEVVQPIVSPQFAPVRERCGYGEYTMKSVPCDITSLLRTLYYGNNAGERLYKDNIPSNLISAVGYSLTAAYSPTDGLAALKKRFNGVKDAYRRLFVENDGEMFKRLVASVSSYYNIVMKKDREMDNEVYALFNADNGAKRVKTTITIEEM